MKNLLSSVEERITESAGELFRKNGYEETSVNDICRKAGVSRSTFYNVFSGKESVVARMFDSAQRSLETGTDIFLTAKNDFERMWMLCDNHLSTVLELGPKVTSAMFRIALCRQEDFMAVQESVNEWCVKLYKNCLAQGIAVSTAKPEELVPLVTAQVNYIAYDWCCAGGSYDLRKKARRAVEVLYGIAPEYCRE